MQEQKFSDAPYLNQEPHLTTYQGYGINGVNLLKLLHSETNLLLETEILSTDHLEALASEADILRVGSRNMDNYELLKAVGKINKPVILKRNMSATLGRISTCC